jgi:hypothetical protein
VKQRQRGSTTAWIESHQELANHPKTKRFRRALGINTPQAIGHLHMLWWWALDYAQDGDLSRFAASDIAEACEWEEEPDDLYSALVEAGWIDACGRLLHWDGCRERFPWRHCGRRPPADEWRRLREFVFTRDDYTCQYCGSRSVRLECDHIFPVARGGGHEVTNLATACRSCNRSKSDKMLEEWVP